MKFETWKDLFMKVAGIEEEDLDQDYEHDIRLLYDKARDD